MIRVFDMFAGYGGAEFALKKAGIEHECVGYSEIDKYAIQCFEQNHKGINYGDCTQIDPDQLPNFDLLCGGFPCQSFSVAGKNLGEQDTRGTLFHEIIRIAEVKKPRYMLLENVKGLTNKNHKETFEKILSELKRIGYYVHWKILNSKEYGIPQNRERIFFVCFWNFPEFAEFQWPQKEELKIFLKDILEEEVDEKYYLSEKQISKLKEYLGKKNKINEEVMNCIGTCFGRSGSSKEECESYARLNKALMIENLKRYQTANRNMEFKEEGVSWCLTGKSDVGIIESNRLRKLTPTECFRLMGFLNDEIKLDGLSNTQKYKLAGNGWDINLVSKIFERMFN